MRHDDRCVVGPAERLDHAAANAPTPKAVFDENVMEHAIDQAISACEAEDDRRVFWHGSDHDPVTFDHALDEVRVKSLHCVALDASMTVSIGCVAVVVLAFGLERVDPGRKNEIVVGVGALANDVGAITHERAPLRLTSWLSAWS